MNCIYCGVKITPDNKYALDSCKSKQCKWRKLKVCCEDCFNCTYTDCMVDEYRIPDETWGFKEQLKLEKKVS